MKLLAFLLSGVFFPMSVMAWDGTDENGSAVTIEEGNLVRPGKTIEVFNSEDGEYRSYDVESIRSSGGSTEIEVYDYDKSEYKTLEMDR